MSYRQTRYVSVLQWGKPMRPYNKVQMLGAALHAASIGWALLWLTGRLAWTPRWVEEPWPFVVMQAIGSLLIYSRREDYVPPDDAQSRREMLRTGVAVMVAIALFALLYTIPEAR